MEKPSQLLAREMEALRESYAALNRNDIEAVVRPFDDQIVWMAPPEFGGSHQGREAVKALFSKSRATWAEGSCEPERFLAGGDKVVVILRVRVRLKHETAWREGRHAAVYTFRDGKAIEQRIFADTQQAIDWSDVPDPEAG